MLLILLLRLLVMLLITTITTPSRRLCRWFTRVGAERADGAERVPALEREEGAQLHQARRQGVQALVGHHRQLHPGRGVCVYVCVCVFIKLYIAAQSGRHPSHSMPLALCVLECVWVRTCVVAYVSVCVCVCLSVCMGVFVCFCAYLY